MLEILEKLGALLQPRERFEAISLFGLYLTIAALEAIGVASIMPFMALVSNPSAIEQIRWLRWIYQELRFENYSAFLIFTGSAFLALITIGNAVSAVGAWLTLRYSHLQGHRFSTRLMEKYLGSRYDFFLNRNSSELGKIILADSAVVAGGILTPLSQFFAKSTVTAFIFLLLLWVDPILTIIVGTSIGGAYAAIYSLVRDSLRKASEETMDADNLRHKIVSESVGGIKEIKVLGHEEFFLSLFRRQSRISADLTAKGLAIAQLPRYLLETIAFGGVLVITLYLILVKKDVNQIIPMVSLYAFAGYRLMPAMQQLFATLTTIRLYQSKLDVLHRDLADNAPPSIHRTNLDSERLTFSQRVILNDVWLSYPGATEPVLRGLNCHIERNTTVAFVGSTGSGKTTTVDIILGLLRPTYGRLIADSSVINDTNCRNWQNLLGYVPQQIYLSDESIARNIAYGVPEAEIDMQAVERAARIARIDEFVLNELPAGFSTEVGERGIRLSGGQRQRLGIARALYTDPEILILDEATSALDSSTEESVMQAIQQLAHRKTIILIAHRLSTVRSCDCIHVIDQGRIIATGTYDSLMTTSAEFRILAGANERAATP